MKQPVFFAADPGRKEEFILETRIWQQDDSFVAEKRCWNQKSASHLDSLVSNYEKLSKLPELNKLVELSRAWKDGRKVFFEFAKGENAEKVLLDAIMAKDEMQVRDIINKLMKIVEVLPSTKTNPTDNPRFKSIFGASYRGSYACTKIGPVDLNLDNFIIDSQGDWHFFDYEWLFDFPIPKLFLKQRFLLKFIIRYQETFRYHIVNLDCLELADRLYIPKVIFENYPQLLKSINKTQLSEAAFIKYVTGRESKPGSIIRFYSKPVKPDKLPDLGIDYLLKQIQEGKELSATIERLQQEKRNILESKTYKTAVAMARIKNKITRR